MLVRFTALAAAEVRNPSTGLLVCGLNEDSARRLARQSHHVYMIVWWEQVIWFRINEREMYPSRWFNVIMEDIPANWVFHSHEADGLVLTTLGPRGFEAGTPSFEGLEEGDPHCRERFRELMAMMDASR